MFRDYKNYEIFADGRIWSKVRKKYLKPSTLPNGYQQVCLTDNEGKQHRLLVHRVTWIAVNGREVPENMELDHIDENKMNNQISNIRLCSHSENCNFGTRNARARKALTNHPDKSKRVGAFKNGELQMVFPSTNEAGRQGFSQGAVSRCCNGKLPHYKGFTWKYLDE